MSKEGFEIKGLKEVDDALKTLDASLRAEVLKRANRDILNRLVKPQLNQLPYNRKRVSTVGARLDKTAVMLGISSKNYWLRFLDGGTKQRQTKEGWNRGIVTGNNRISNIIENSAEGVIEEVRENYSDIITKHLNRKIKSINKRLMKL